MLYEKILYMVSTAQEHVTWSLPGLAQGEQVLQL